jgi:hypothetical protein
MEKMKSLKSLFVSISFILVIGSFTLISNCSYPGANDSSVVVLQNDSVLEINNGIIKCLLQSNSSRITQSFYALRQDDWELIAESFIRDQGITGDGVTPLYASGPEYANDFRLHANEGYTSFSIISSTNDEAQILVAGKIGNHAIEQTISLKKGQDFFHVEVSGELSGTLPEMEYFLSTYTFSPGGDPDYTYAPALKRSEEDVIGDRKFYAPAAIIQKDRLMFALVPDLDLINNNIVYAFEARPSKAPKLLAIEVDPDKVSMPVAIDLSLNSGISENALVSYGFMDYLLEQHVYFKHENRNGTMVRSLSEKKLRYGFDLFLKADVPGFYGYQRISSYLWERYGTGYFNLPRPQAMPFSEYARICYPAAIEYQGYIVTYDRPVKMSFEHRSGQPEMASWQQWESNGIPAGGFRSNDNLNKREHVLYFGAHLNNVDDAVGMHYWGKKLNDSTLVDKARRIINLALSAPQNQGIFPNGYDIDNHSWSKGDYHTEAASATAGFLLYYYRFCEDFPGILPFVRRYAEFLINNTQSDGCLPTFYNSSLEPLPRLNWNASGGAHIWVLCELYKLTGEEKLLETAVVLANFMIREVLPLKKWYDREAFYGCGNKPETFVDLRTGQFPANTQSLYWAIKGFTSMYEILRDKQYLEALEAVADYSIFFQAVWNPHFVITAYPYGGFGVQNTDAEWLDQRNHRFAVALLDAGLVSGRQDLMERAVAALRASFTLVNHPRHIQNNIYNYPNYPFGIGPENIDHDGYPQMPLRSGPNWGETGALSAAASFLGRIGGVYINFEKNIAVGIDGISINEYEMDGNKIRITLQSQLSQLRVPYDDGFFVEMKIEGLPSEDYELIVNKGQGYKVSSEELTSVNLFADADGAIVLSVRD